MAYPLIIGNNGCQLEEKDLTTVRVLSRIQRITGISEWRQKIAAFQVSDASQELICSIARVICTHVEQT